jgi:hypothetical protein
MGAEFNIVNGGYSGDIHANVSFSIDIVFDGPPISTVMFVQTNFSASENMHSTNVAVPPGATFLLTINAELRYPLSANKAPLPLAYKGTIALTAGQTLIDALRSDIVAQIPDNNLKQMINITFIPSNPVFNSADQVSIGIDNVQVADGYVIPRYLSITQSTCPFIADWICAPSNSRVLFHDFKADIGLVADVSVDSIGGKLGIIEIESRDIGGHVEVGFALQNKPERKYLSLVDIFSAVSKKVSTFSFFSPFFSPSNRLSLVGRLPQHVQHRALLQHVLSHRQDRLQVLQHPSRRHPVHPPIPGQALDIRRLEEARCHRLAGGAGEAAE